MWTVEEFPLFRNGLEPIRVGSGARILVANAGGVLLDDEDSAWDAAEGYMYPTGSRTAPPAPEGRFVSVPFCGRPLFVPRLSADLIAA